MREEASKSRSPADYDVVFARVKDLQHVEILSAVEEVSRQAENIRLVMDAIERVESPRVVTFTTR